MTVDLRRTNGHSPRRWIGPLGAALVLVVTLGGGNDAIALECPVAEAQTNQHVLRESQKTIDELSELLETGDVSNRIGEIIVAMKRKYPAFSEAELVNYFVTAYCPVVDKMDGLSEDEKKSRLDQFSSQVFQAVEASQ